MSFIALEAIKKTIICLFLYLSFHMPRLCVSGPFKDKYILNDIELNFNRIGNDDN